MGKKTHPTRVRSKKGEKKAENINRELDVELARHEKLILQYGGGQASALARMAEIKKDIAFRRMAKYDPKWRQNNVIFGDEDNPLKTVTEIVVRRVGPVVGAVK